MRKLFILILIFVSFNFKSLSQSACMNEDFEQFSLTHTTPSTINITSQTGISGWSVTAGTFTGSLNACNMSTCCLLAPSSVQIIGTTLSTGHIDPLIGPSYPIFSVMGNTSNPNSNPFYPAYGNWFIKLNDTIPNGEAQILTKSFAVTPANCFFDLAFLPVLKNSIHPNCYKPTFKVRAIIPSVCSSIPLFTSTEITLNTSIITTGTACPTYSPNFIPCPLNNSYSYIPWQKTTIDLSTYIGSCAIIEILISDCSFGDHSGYVYFDSQCRNYGFFNIICGLPSVGFQNVYSTCGASVIPAIAPSGFISYLWNGPLGWPSNGATTQSVNLTLPGTYTSSFLGLGQCSPLTRTITIIATPTVTASLSLSQNTACAGGNTIALNGNPSGGNYSGINVTGNTFNPLSSGNYTVQYKYTDSNSCCDSISKIINVLNCSTNISSTSNSNIFFEVVPNPSEKEVIIQSNLNIPSYSIIIINSLGQEVIRTDFSGGMQKIRIDLLPNGIYFVQLKNNEDVVLTRKIIKN